MSKSQVEGIRRLQLPDGADRLLPTGVEVQLRTIDLAAAVHAQTPQVNRGLVVITELIDDL
jgi:hypothetical protein